MSATVPDATVAPASPRRRQTKVTANAAETIMARIPVAYAPACASTFALNKMVMAIAMVVWMSTTGRTARPHSGVIP